MDDPRSVLGVGPDATPADLSRARRRLAKALHPDLHDSTTRGDAERRMALVNLAYDALTSAPALSLPPASSSAPGPAPAAEGAAADYADAAFAIEALPVDAYEATLLAAVDLGDVIRTEEPYLMAVLLDVPGPCHCVLEFAPDAGATTVSIEVSSRHFGTCPPARDVRDAFVAEIERQAAGSRT